ncbi:hypothetical protein Q604_UNBC08056G0002, partial [human gut metagenome]
HLPGVINVIPQGAGFDLTITEDHVGHDIFTYVTKNGYIPAFSQQPPTLDDIFRQEVAHNA